MSVMAQNPFCSEVGNIAEGGLESIWLWRTCLVELKTFGTRLQGIDLSFIRSGYDAHISQCCKIVSEYDIEAIALTVGGIAHAIDAPDEDARRENAGEAGCLNDLTLPGLGISRHVCHVGGTRVAAVPLQIAEIILPANAARDARLAVRDGND